MCTKICVRDCTVHYYSHVKIPGGFPTMADTCPRTLPNKIVLTYFPADTKEFWAGLESAKIS